MYFQFLLCRQISGVIEFLVVYFIVIGLCFVVFCVSEWLLVYGMILFIEMFVRLQIVGSMLMVEIGVFISFVVMLGVEIISGICVEFLKKFILNYRLCLFSMLL